VFLRAHDWSLSEAEGINPHSWNTRVGTLIVATIYLQLIQNRYMFRSFTVLQCSHQHCVQPVASDVEVVKTLVAERKLRNSKCSLFPLPLISNLFDPNTPQSTLFSVTLTLPCLEEWHPVQF